jgi:antitoxin component YwqK of YwqJK toxin-antitoxin module
MRITSLCCGLVAALGLVLSGLDASAQGTSKLDIAPGGTTVNQPANPHGHPSAMPATTGDENPHVAPMRPTTPPAAINEEETEPITERYPNGNVKIERHVVKDSAGNYVNHGMYTAYDQDGKVQRMGAFLQGKQQGKWTQSFLHDEGHLFSTANDTEYTGPFTAEATFVDGQLDGTWTIRDRNGQNIIEWNFDHGVRNGTWTWWYGNGKKRLDAIYKNGKLDGDVMESSQDGQQEASKTTFVEGRQLAKAVGWYTLGQKRFEGYYLRVVGMAEPTYDWWNGTITISANVPTGEDQKHGAWVEWYQSGKKKIEAQYDHGVPTGRFVWWYENGQKQAEVEYQNGVLNGIWITWHPNGQKESQAEYRDGKLVDKLMHWDASGKLVDVRNSTPKQYSNTYPDAPNNNRTTTRPWSGSPILRSR